jgi:hypothetical protein
MNIIEEWNMTGFQPPQVPVAVNQRGDKFLVIQDNSSLIKIIDSAAKIYMVSKKNCKIKIDNNIVYYECSEPTHLTSCTKPENDREKFAIEVLLNKFL